MIVKCDKCQMYYDDQFRTTICPHGTFPVNDGDNNFAHHPESYLFPEDCYSGGGLPSSSGVWTESGAGTLPDKTTIKASLSIPLATVIPRVEYLINPNPNQCDPPTQGIEIAFSADNYMAVRLANNHEIGFVLSQAAALQLADLINLELPRNEFNLVG